MATGTIARHFQSLAIFSLDFPGGRVTPEIRHSYVNFRRSSSATILPPPLDSVDGVRGTRPPPRDFSSCLRGIRPLEPQPSVDCIVEYRWENNFSSPSRERERDEDGGVDDSIRNVFGLRPRLVKSFAGIVNPTRLVIPSTIFPLWGTRMDEGWTMTREISMAKYPIKTINATFSRI